MTENKQKEIIFIATSYGIIAMDRQEFEEAIEKSYWGESVRC